MITIDFYKKSFNVYAHIDGDADFTYHLRRRQHNKDVILCDCLSYSSPLKRYIQVDMDYTKLYYHDLCSIGTEK